MSRQQEVPMLISRPFKIMNRPSHFNQYPFSKARTMQHVSRLVMLQPMPRIDIRSLNNPQAQFGQGWTRHQTASCLPRCYTPATFDQLHRPKHQLVHQPMPTKSLLEVSPRTSHVICSCLPCMEKLVCHSNSVELPRNSQCVPNTRGMSATQQISYDILVISKK